MGGGTTNTVIDLQFTDMHGMQHSIPLNPDKTVLENILIAGFYARKSCLAGSCQTCLMQCDTPELLPLESQERLTSADIKRNLFLPCITRVGESIQVRALASLKPVVQVRVLEKEFLSKDILRLRVQAGFGFQSGQFCNLFKDEETYRAYSIANKSADNYLEFHIKRLNGGELSAWLADELQVDDRIGIQGPFGNCVYRIKERTSPMLLCGIGTGLAPLYGILQQALAMKHQGDIKLIIGARDGHNFYLREELAALAGQNANLSVHFLALENAQDDVLQADIYEQVGRQFDDLSQHAVYLCGAQNFVEKMKAVCLQKGAQLERLRADSFFAAS